MPIIILFVTGFGLKLLWAAFNRKPLKPVLDDEAKRLSDEWDKANQHDPFNWVILIAVPIVIVIGVVILANSHK